MLQYLQTMGSFLMPVSGIIVNSCWEISFESDVVSSKMDIVRVWFSPSVYMEALLLRLLSLALFKSYKSAVLSVLSTANRFVFLFSMPTVTALFLPRSDLGCALAL